MARKSVSQPITQSFEDMSQSQNGTQGLSDEDLHSILIRPLALVWRDSRRRILASFQQSHEEQPLQMSYRLSASSTFDRACANGHHDTTRKHVRHRGWKNGEWIWSLSHPSNRPLLSVNAVVVEERRRLSEINKGMKKGLEAAGLLDGREKAVLYHLRLESAVRFRSVEDWMAWAKGEVEEGKAEAAWDAIARSGMMLNG